MSRGQGNDIGTDVLELYFCCSIAFKKVCLTLNGR
jgi:hypothetical protein